VAGKLTAATTRMSNSPPTDSYRRRCAIVQAFLADQAPQLAGLYKLAAGLVDDQPDGWVPVVAHAGRELMNRMFEYITSAPAVLNDDSEGNEDDPKFLQPQDIADRLRGALEAGDEAVRVAAQGIVDGVDAGRDATRERAEALIAEAEAGEPTDGAATRAWVSGWSRQHSIFVELTHVRGPSALPPSAELMVAAWRELTDYLARLAGEPFFESMDDLLDLASQAPTSDLVRRALTRLRPGTETRFYAELVDPTWVALLKEQGLFDHPPPAVREGNAIYFPPWLEATVLDRFVLSAPEQVASAAVAVPESDNARVAWALASIAAELPAELAADSGLSHRVAQDLDATARLLDTTEPAGKLAMQLAHANRRGKARELLKAFLRIDVRSVPSGSEILPDFRSGQFRHEEYLVDEITRPLVTVMVDRDPEGTIKVLIKALAGAQRRLSHRDSTIWRDSIDEVQAPYAGDPRHLLVELLRDACTAASENPDMATWILDQLAEQESCIFGRLAWHLLAVVPGEAERRCAILLDPATLFLADGRREIAELLPVGFPQMTVEDQARLIAMIRTVPDPSQILPAGEDGELQVQVQRWQDTWRQHLLAVLESHLGADGEAHLRQLRAEHGPDEDLDAGRPRATSFGGPSSPATAADLGAMDQEELLALLRHFESGESFFAPTSEGLGGELSVAVKQNPAAWMWIAEHVSELAPTYVRSWLFGLLEVARAGQQVAEIVTVLTVLDWVLEQPAQADEYVFSQDGDADHYAAQRTGADLLAELLAKGLIALEDREHVWAIIGRLIENPDPTQERGERSEAEPMEFAWSAIRPLGAIAVVRYLQWLGGQLPAGEGPDQAGFDAAPEAKPVLERLIAEDPSAAVRAALASELPILAAVDRAWLHERVQSFVDPAHDELARVGWQTYLEYANPPSRLTVQILHAAYRRAIRALAESGPELDSERRELADHVAAIWREDPEVGPGLMEAFMSSAQDADRARAIMTLGFDLNPRGPSGYDPSPEALEHHRQLWDRRLDDSPGPQELREYERWWSSRRFAQPDDLRRLTRSVELNAAAPGEMRPALMLAATLVSSDSAFVEPAFCFVETVAGGNSLRPMRVDVDVLRQLVQPALSVPELRERAVALVHRLGELGYLPLRGLLD
jgi:hypothetical protein